ncbi:MAG: hypothetical protein ACYDHN_13365 [Solirubrobacteraceae bacterium]
MTSKQTGASASETQSAAGVEKRVSTSTSRARTAHPLLGAFPLAVMTLATFLVLFALLMARLTAGFDPALRAQTPVVRTIGPAGEAVTTRVSGSKSAASTQPAVVRGGTSGGQVLVTRTSGVTGVGGKSDD